MSIKPFRICISNVTASFLAGGLETYCWEIGRALARRGHAVTLATGVPPIRQAARHTEMTVQTFPFRLEQNWPNFGSRFRRLMERGSFYRYALPWLLQQQFDVILVNKPFDFPYLWWAKRQGLRSQIVFRSGGREFFWLDKYFAQCVEVWLSTSRYNAAQLEAHYQRPVQVVHNGVDTEQFNFSELARQTQRQLWQQQFDLPGNAFVIGSVGRLVAWKGLRLIIQALPSLPAQVHYVVCGEGPARAELQQLAQQLGVAARVHFVGRVAHANLPHTLAALDCFVQPSIGEESFGISVVEAMACARPVLVAENGGLTEIVNDPRVGMVLPRGDGKAWQLALANLVDNPLFRQNLGQQARARVVEQFTWAQNAATLESLWRRAFP